VAIPAGPASRKRQKRVVIEGDFFSFFAVFIFKEKRNNMNWMCPAAVTFIAEKFLLGLGSSTQNQQAHKARQYQYFSQCTFNPFLSKNV
jgi:hypothetical protein